MSAYRTLLDRGSWPLIVLFLAAAGAAGWFLPSTRIEAGTDVMLNQADPDLQYYNQSRRDWNTTDEYVIFCCSRDGWFDEAGRELLLGFAAAAKGLPHVRSVTALSTVPLLRTKPPVLVGVPQPTTLDAADFFVDGGEALGAEARARRLERAKAELLGHTQAVGNLVSASGRDISVLAYLDVPADIERLEPRRQELLQKPRSPEVGRELAEIEGPYQAALVELGVRRRALVDASRKLAADWGPRMAEPIRLAGIPILNRNIIEHVGDDVKTFGVVSLGAFLLTFLAIYRRPRWVILPILACFVPVQIVLGTMAATGQRLTVITSNLPVLLFVLALPYAVYLVERYRERRSLHPHEDAPEVAAASARDIWLPCLYSATTTMAGTASLLTSGIVPVRTFGLMATIGMALVLGSVFLFLAACVRRLKPIEVRGVGIQSEVIRPLRPLVTLSTRAPAAVLVVALAILGVSAWGTSKVTAETKVIDYFWPSSETYVGLEYVDARMGGTTPLEIILRGPAGHWKTRAGLDQVDRVAAYFQSVPETGNVRSIKSLVDEIAKALKPRPGQDPTERAIATVQRFSPSTVREFCTPDFATTRLLVRMRETAPTLNRKRILDGLQAHLGREEFAGLPERRATGVFLLYSNLLQDLLKSQRDTFLMVLAAIYVMVAICFRDPLLGLIVLFPQVLPVLLVLGVMGFFHIALDLVTTMIASMAMGVGIDAAIQYAMRYRAELAESGAAVEAVRRSHATIGRSILIATSIVFAGFLVLGFSKFVPTVWFGLFTGLAMLMGLAGSLTILPAMFVLLGYPRPPTSPGPRPGP